MEIDINNPEQIKLMISLLQNLLDKQGGENQTEPETIHQNNIKSKSINRSKNNRSKNKFVDMPEKNMHKEDVDFDKKVSRFPPTPRSRKYIPVDVKCRSCGKQEKVNPAILPDSADRYKCNKCSTISGS